MGKDISFLKNTKQNESLKDSVKNSFKKKPLPQAKVKSVEFKEIKTPKTIPELDLLVTKLDIAMKNYDEDGKNREIYAKDIRDIKKALNLKYDAWLDKVNIDENILRRAVIGSKGRVFFEGELITQGTKHLPVFEKLEKMNLFNFGS